MDNLLRVVPALEYRILDAKTTAKFAEVWKIFPAWEQMAPPTKK